MVDLDVANLHVGFTLDDRRIVHAVRGVDLQVRRGQRYGIVGESGCGKSTLLMALLGLLPANAIVSGQVRLRGKEILADDAALRGVRWKEVAVVFQGAMNALNPVKTIGWQIAEPVRLHGGPTSRRAVDARVGDLLELVGIPQGRMHAYPHELSGGMRQRAAIAMALACDPMVLLADEPTSALDVVTQAQIMRLLTGLCEQRDLALVLVSHDLPLVTEYCDDVAVMYGGRLVETAPADAIEASSLHHYTRALFGSIPDPDATALPAPLEGAPPRLDRWIAGCAFRPRCSMAIDRCAVEEPVMLPVHVLGHRSACHRARQLASIDEGADWTAGRVQ